MAIGLTLLAYRYEGMRLTDLRDVARSLKRQLLQEQGAFEERPSHVLMRAFVESGLAEQQAARRAAARAAHERARPHLLRVASVDDKSAAAHEKGHAPSRVRRLRESHSEDAGAPAVPAAPAGPFAHDAHACIEGARSGDGATTALAEFRRVPGRVVESRTDDQRPSFIESGRTSGVLPLHLLQPEDGEHLAALSRAARFSRPLISHYLRSFVFPAVLRPQRAKTTATGHDLASDAIFRCVLGFSGTASDLVPLSLLPVQYEAGTDASVARVLTDPDCVSIVHFPSAEWDVMRLLQFVAASSRYRAFIDLGAAVTGLSSRAVAAALLTMGLAHVDGAVYVEPDGRRCVLLRALAAEAVGESAAAHAGAAAPAASVLAPGHALGLRAGSGAIAGANLPVLPAAASGGAALHVDVLRSPLFRALMTRVTPIPLARCGVPKERLFAVFSQAHCTGTDIPQAADTVALLTVGPGATWRDFSQAAFRLRQLGHGQRVHTLVTREVAGLIRAACTGLPKSVFAAARSGAEPESHLTPLHLAAWLLQNSHRHESAQRLSLTWQRLAHIGRAYSLRALLGTSIRNLQAVAAEWASLACGAVAEAATAEMQALDAADAAGAAEEMGAAATAAAGAGPPIVYTRFLWGLPAIPPPWHRVDGAADDQPAAGAEPGAGAGAGAGAGGSAGGDSSVPTGAATATAAAANDVLLPVSLTYAKFLSLDARVHAPRVALPSAARALLQLVPRHGTDDDGSEAQAAADTVIPRDAWLRACAGSHLEQMQHDVSDEPIPAPSFVGTLAQSLAEQHGTLCAALASDPGATEQLQQILSATVKPRTAVMSIGSVESRSGTDVSAKAEDPSCLGADELLADARLDTEQQQEVEQEVEVFTEVQSDLSRPVSATGLDACGNTPWRLASLLRFLDVGAETASKPSMQLDLLRGDPFPFALMLHGALRAETSPAAEAVASSSAVVAGNSEQQALPLLVSCNHTRLRGQISTQAAAVSGADAAHAAEATAAASSVQLSTPTFMRNVFALGHIRAAVVNCTGAAGAGAGVASSGPWHQDLGGGTVVLSLAEAESMLLQLRAAGTLSRSRDSESSTGPSLRVSVTLHLLPPSSPSASGSNEGAVASHAGGVVGHSELFLPLPHHGDVDGTLERAMLHVGSAVDCLAVGGLPVAARALARLLDGQVWLSQEEVAALLISHSTGALPRLGASGANAGTDATQSDIRPVAQALVPTSASTGPQSWTVPLPTSSMAFAFADVDRGSRQQLFARILRAHRRDRPSAHGTGIAAALVLPDAAAFSGHVQRVTAARAALVTAFGSLPKAFAALCACASGLSQASSSENAAVTARVRAHVRDAAAAAASAAAAQTAAGKPAALSAASVRPELLLRTSLPFSVLAAALEELVSRPGDSDTASSLSWSTHVWLPRLLRDWAALLELKNEPAEFLRGCTSTERKASWSDGSSIGGQTLQYFDLLALLQTAHASQQAPARSGSARRAASGAVSDTSVASATRESSSPGLLLSRLPLNDAATAGAAQGASVVLKADVETAAYRDDVGGARGADVARQRARTRALRRVAAGQLNATEVSAVGELAVRDVFTAPSVAAAGPGARPGVGPGVGPGAEAGTYGPARHRLSAVGEALPTVCIHDGTIIRIMTSPAATRTDSLLTRNTTAAVSEQSTLPAWDASALVTARALLLQPPPRQSASPITRGFTPDASEPAWFFECQVGPDIQDAAWLLQSQEQSAGESDASSEPSPEACRPIAALGVLLHFHSRSAGSGSMRKAELSAEAPTLAATMSPLARASSDSVDCSAPEVAAIGGIFGLLIRAGGAAAASGMLTAEVIVPAAAHTTRSSAGDDATESITARVPIPAGARIGFALQYGSAPSCGACLRLLVSVDGSPLPRLQLPLISVAAAEAAGSTTPRSPAGSHVHVHGHHDGPTRRAASRLVGAQPAAWLRQGFAVALDLGRFRRHRDGLGADDILRSLHIAADAADAVDAVDAADAEPAVSAAAAVDELKLPSAPAQIVAKSRRTFGLQRSRVQWAWDAVLRLVNKVMREQAGSTLGDVIGASGSAQLKITRPTTRPVPLSPSQQSRLAELMGLEGRARVSAGVSSAVSSPSKSALAGERAVSAARASASTPELPNLPRSITVRPEEWRVECLPIARFPSALVSGVAATHGRVYFEIVVGDAGIGQVGVADVRFVGASLRGVGVGDDKSSFAVDGHRLLTWFAGSRAFGSAWRTGSVLGVALDLDARTVAFSLDGSWAAPWGTAFVNTTVSGGWTPALSLQRWRPGFSGTLCLGAALAAPAVQVAGAGSGAGAGTSPLRSPAGAAATASADAHREAEPLKVATCAAFRFAPPSPDYKPIASLWLPCIDDMKQSGSVATFDRPCRDDTAAGNLGKSEGTPEEETGCPVPAQQAEAPSQATPWRVVAGAANALINGSPEVLRRMMPDIAELPMLPESTGGAEIAGGSGKEAEAARSHNGVTSTWGTVVLAMRPQSSHTNGSSSEQQRVLLRLQIIRPGSFAVSVRWRAAAAITAAGSGADGPATLLDASDAHGIARSLLLGPLPRSAGGASTLLHVQPFRMPSEDEDASFSATAADAAAGDGASSSAASSLSVARRPRWLELVPLVAAALLPRPAAAAGTNSIGSEQARVLEASFVDKAEPLGLIDNRAARRREASPSAAAAAARMASGEIASSGVDADAACQTRARNAASGARLGAYVSAATPDKAALQPLSVATCASASQKPLRRGDIVEVSVSCAGEVYFTVHQLSGAAVDAGPASVAAPKTSAESTTDGSQMRLASMSLTVPAVRGSISVPYETLLAIDPGCVLRLL